MNTTNIAVCTILSLVSIVQGYTYDANAHSDRLTTRHRSSLKTHEMCFNRAIQQAQQEGRSSLDPERYKLLSAQGSTELFEFRDNIEVDFGTCLYIQSSIILYKFNADLVMESAEKVYANKPYELLNSIYYLHEVKRVFEADRPDRRENYTLGDNELITYYHEIGAHFREVLLSVPEDPVNSSHMTYPGGPVVSVDPIVKLIDPSDSLAAYQIPRS